MQKLFFILFLILATVGYGQNPTLIYSDNGIACDRHSGKVTLSLDANGSGVLKNLEITDTLSVATNASRLYRITAADITWLEDINGGVPLASSINYDTFIGDTGARMTICWQQGHNFLKGWEVNTNSATCDMSGNIVVNQFQSKGSMTFPIRVTTTNDFMSASDFMVIQKAANITNTLPDATTCTGRVYGVGRDTSAGNTVVAAAANQTIAGVTVQVIVADHSTQMFISDGGTNWNTW